MHGDFPNDENGELLQLMQEQGDDLSKARAIDFFVVFATKPQAEAFAGVASAALHLPARISRYEKTDRWQVAVTRRMAPEHAAVTALDRQLSQLGRAHGGEPDGWGCPRVEAGTRPRSAG